MSSRRPVNKRGQGVALREEIEQAAIRRLGVAGSGEAVTLRAIAREAGIAAPSIYPHFTDRDAILDAVVSRTFSELGHACSIAAAGADCSLGEVRAICDAYTTFAAEHPGQYRLLFERSPDNVSGRSYPAGLEAFELLADAIARTVTDESSTSTDPARDAQALWAALHGLITIVPATPSFPWRPTQNILHHMIDALCEIPTP